MFKIFSPMLVNSCFNTVNTVVKMAIKHCFVLVVMAKGQI
jgi:hypothetical protein